MMAGQGYVGCAINTGGVLWPGNQASQCKAELSYSPKMQLQFRNCLLGLVLVLLFLLRHFWASHGLPMGYCSLSQVLWFNSSWQLSPRQPLTPSLPGGMGERIRKVRKLVG